MILITANIQNLPNLTDREVRQDVRTVTSSKAPGTHPRFVVWQEIEDPADKLAIYQIMGDRYVHRATAESAPTSIPRGWQIHEHRRTRTHDGIRLVTPHRLFTTTVVANPRRPELDPIAIIGTHMISSAWSNRVVPLKARRRALWNQHWDMMRAEVERLQALGLTVLIAGDLNRVNPPKLVPGMKWIGGGGLDHIGLVPGSVAVKVQARGRLPLNSDHDARWVRLGLSKA